jgi:hypothetical protein
MQKCPYLSEPKRFGSEAQAPLPPNDTPKLDTKGIKRVQYIVGSILYHARAIDMTVLMALSSIAIEQTKATEKTMDRCIQLLDYLPTNQMAKIRFYASKMILNIILTCLTSQRPEPTADYVDIFSWAECQKTTNQYS